MMCYCLLNTDFIHQNFNPNTDDMTVCVQQWEDPIITLATITMMEKDKTWNQYGGTGITLTANMWSRMTENGSSGDPTNLGR